MLDYRDFKWAEQRLSDECHKELIFMGHEGCEVFDSAGLLRFVEAYLRVIMIILGLILTFWGSKFIIWGATFLSFVGVSCLLFFFFYNMELIRDPRYRPADETGFPWLFAVIVAVCLIVGAIAAYYFKRFFESYVVTLLGAFCGGVVMYVLSSPINIVLAVKVLAMLLGALIGGRMARKADKYIKSVLTAITGACMLCWGVVHYVPPQKDEHGKLYEKGTLEDPRTVG